MRASADYYVLFEHNGQLLQRTPVPMMYVAHPPDQVLIPGIDDLYQVVQPGITWTPGKTNHYVLHVVPVSSLLPDWVAGLTTVGKKAS